MGASNDQDRNCLKAQTAMLIDKSGSNEHAQSLGLKVKKGICQEGEGESEEWEEAGDCRMESGNHLEMSLMLVIQCKILQKNGMAFTKPTAEEKEYTHKLLKLLDNPMTFYIIIQSINIRHKYKQIFKAT